MKTENQHFDLHYIEALLQDNGRVIEEIYKKFSGQASTIVLANSGTLEDARDIFQEALIAITRRARAKGLTLTCPFKNYLQMVCYGKWLNELKKRSRRPVTIAESERYISDHAAKNLAEETLQDDERWKLFEEKFLELSEECQKVLRLALDKMHQKEAAELLGYTYGFFRVKKTKCKSKLEQKIKDAHPKP